MIGRPSTAHASAPLTELILQLLTVIAPVFIAIGVGFGWARLGREYETRMVTDLVLYVGAPALIFHTLSTAAVSPASMSRMVLATLAALAVLAAAGLVSLRLLRLPVRSFLPSLVFPNIGNMGLPLCLFAFGPEGLALAIVLFAATSIVHFTLGMWLVSGALSPKQLFRAPLIYAVALAALCNLLDWTLPTWLANTTELLGQFTIPLMLITLGVSLARLRVRHINRAMLISLFRLGLGVTVGLLIAWLFGLEGAARGVMVLECAMPTAVFNYLLAQKYQRDAEAVAGVVVLSTTMSLLYLPALIWYLWQ